MIDYSTYHHKTCTDVLVVEASGKLDMTTADFLLNCIQGLIDRGEKKVVIDCSGLEYVNSVGLASLVRANSRLKQKGGALAISGASGVVADVLRIVHFDRLFHLYPNVDAAAKAI